MQVLAISQTRASRNLNILYDAGFLKLRREGLWAYYSIDKADLDGCVSLLLDALERGLKDDKVAASDRGRLKDAERLGPQCRGPASVKPGVPS